MTDPYSVLLAFPIGIIGSILLIIVFNYFDDRDPEHLAFVKRRLSNGVCNDGPYQCKYKDTIEGKPGCRKPPFESCEYNISPEKYFGKANTIHEWNVRSLTNKEKETQ